MKKVLIYRILSITAYILAIVGLCFFLFTPSFFATTESGAGYIWDEISFCFKCVDFDTTGLSNEAASSTILTSCFCILNGVMCIIFTLAIVCVLVSSVMCIVKLIISIVKKEPINVTKTTMNFQGKEKEKLRFLEGNLGGLGVALFPFIIMFWETWMLCITLEINQDYYWDLLKEIYFGVSSNPTCVIYIPCILGVISFGIGLTCYILIKKEIKEGSDLVVIKEKVKHNKKKKETEEQEEKE